MIPDTRTPFELLDFLAPMLAGKIFCDLGPADGQFLEIAARYCRQAIGMQLLQGFEDDYEKLIRKPGIKVYEGDVRKAPWPTADIYYYYIYSQYIKDVVQKSKEYPGIFIIGGTPEKFKSYPSDAWRDGVVIDFPITSQEGKIWRISIMKN